MRAEAARRHQYDVRPRLCTPWRSTTRAGCRQGRSHRASRRPADSRCGDRSACLLGCCTRCGKLNDHRTVRGCRVASPVSLLPVLCASMRTNAWWSLAAPNAEVPDHHHDSTVDSLAGIPGSGRRRLIPDRGSAVMRLLTARVGTSLPIRKAGTCGFSAGEHRGFVREERRSPGRPGLLRQRGRGTAHLRPAWAGV